MGLWIPFTLMAAFMQSWRNAFQNRLSKEVNTAGVTLARFLWASPLAVLYLVLLYHFKPVAMPHFDAPFVLTILAASVSQIFATALMVMLFRLRNYAIGVGLAKSEAVIAAALGAVFFSAPLTALAWAGVIIGAVAVWLMSNTGPVRELPLKTVVTGLGSGLCFALTTLWVREAALMLDLTFPHSAAWVLLWVISTQTLIMLVWLLVRDPATLRALWSRPRLVMLTSLFSFLGSVGWFTAMSLETVAMVKTLGQVEVLFTLAISARWFKERLGLRDFLGLAFIVVGAVCVIVA
ncbi:Permeases of the drug/metabolite transporter (DMT) superfamily [Marinobacterium lacunae]|uniref:Permeases of the drug/metabolite transporter (DMT) superfamily n=1 Tax=Marinobacterium lacunae TaxID=1232683 RepID=A0A081FUC4_9GAMM|nr:DMT family transporter [Marinobacterium lacunae]KEA62129.1 Permeases of the drug/metabolite transporter (DMT) superfamily [Marinobacterium lacunae]